MSKRRLWLLPIAAVMLLALSGWITAIYATSFFEGFGFASSVVGLIAIGVTIFQVIEAKNVAMAARDAAENAAKEMRNRHYRNSLVNGRRLLGN